MAAPDTVKEQEQGQEVGQGLNYGPESSERDDAHDSEHQSVDPLRQRTALVAAMSRDRVAL